MSKAAPILEFKVSLTQGKWQNGCPSVASDTLHPLWHGGLRTGGCKPGPSHAHSLTLSLSFLFPLPP